MRYSIQTKSSSIPLEISLYNALALNVYDKRIMSIFTAGSRPKKTSGTCRIQKFRATRHPMPNVNFQLSHRLWANASKKKIKDSVSTTV